jgi:GNAT superfamily N-acetyltransferase/RimJ/RimL family protein N-acetyltransferase
MRIEQFDAAGDPAAARALYDVYAAGAPVDEPGSPPMSFGVFRVMLEQGWCCEPREAWLARPEPGAGGDAVVGGYTLELPDRENLHRSGLWIVVAPGRRRAGLGAALLRHASARASELGRSRLTGDVRAGTPADAFACAAGAAAELTEARRTLDVRSIPAGRLAELRATIKAVSAGYGLLEWSGPVPEAYLDAVAALNEAMGDAPRSAGAERQSWDAERVRQTGRRAIRQGLRHYSVAARHEATGELAGLTEVSIDPADPEWGHQELTAVVRGHRGHRLGLLLKVAMLELLAERESQLERIETYNAESNTHMVAINEILGYQVAGRLTFRQLATAADRP